jgi:hypothetical protein
VVWCWGEVSLRSGFTAGNGCQVLQWVVRPLSSSGPPIAHLLSHIGCLKQGDPGSPFHPELGPTIALVGRTCLFSPGQIREFFTFIQQPEGRIHFAGDWVGGIPGYMHGAVLSAHAVVRSIQAG